MSIKEPSIDELEKLQNTFLFRIPDFYKDKAHSNYQDILYKLFSPILEYFVDNLKWFNVWRKIVGEEIPQLDFLVDKDPDARKIVNMYRSPEWKKILFDYVTIPSMFCQKYDKEDVSFIYTINNLEEENPFPKMNKYIITLNLKDIISGIRQYNYSNDSQPLEKKVIRGLEHYYSELKKNEYLITAIHNKLKETFENKDIKNEDVIKLINCYFWVRLAYPEEWKVMLYSPGIISKKVDSIPFGVNIGLKENPSLSVILFLKKITLLFFSRESVDFFEEKAKREADIRVKQEKEIAHLLFEFPHIVGNYVSRAIGRSLQFGDIQTASELAWFIGKAGTYMSSTLATSEPSKEKYKLKECLEKFKNIPLGLTLNTPINDINEYNSELVAWKSMFGQKLDIEDSLAIWLPEGVLETIFSNLLSNTKKMNNKRPFLLVSISAKKENSYITLIYKEIHSEGFTLEIIKNIKRWALEGPREDEYHKGFGYRSIYKASVEICKGIFEIIILHNEKEINILSDNIPDDLGNNKLHPIHRFTFETDSDNVSKENTLDIFGL